MATSNKPGSNARMIHKYVQHLRHAKGRSEATIDQVTNTIADFLNTIGGKDLKKFKPDWAIAYKEKLANQSSQRSPGGLALSTINGRLNHVRGFFLWLAEEAGYRSRLKISDASYFTPRTNDRNAAKALERRNAPTLQQIKLLITSKPVATSAQKRDRAMIAFILLTGARADAAASFPLGNVDISKRCAFFEGAFIRTKFRKNYTADWFSVGDEIEGIFVDWVNHLRNELLLGNNDPLFPATRIVLGQTRTFAAGELSRNFWKSSEPVRRAFRTACEEAGVPYFNPHSIRTTLGILGQEVCQSPEELKAWSQSLGHDSVDTTLRYYGRQNDYRQSELMKGIRNRSRTRKPG